jgi:hypothetical protein
MTALLYHQCGHNSAWSIEALVQDKVGDGLILSPVHYSMPNVIKLSARIRKRSIFDPQYYLPNSQKTKLNTYPFFPEKLSGGFSTANFSQFAHDSANRCLKFQIDQDFQHLIIPARYLPQMYPDYKDRQESYTVAPFLNALGMLGKNKKPVLLTLPLTSHMLEHKGYRTEILNWVTSFPEIDGIYLIVDFERPTKQIQSAEYLLNYLQFLRDLHSADLKVISGYLNTEALLVLTAGDFDITFGTFENTRMFSIDKFLTTEEERRGPKPRIYLPGLLNWIQFDQAKEIRRVAPDVWKRVYKPTDYAEKTLRAAVDPYFTQQELYRHFLICFHEQVNLLRDSALQERRPLLEGWISSAIKAYQEISQAGIFIELHGNGNHLPVWKDVMSSI